MAAAQAIPGFRPRLLGGSAAKSTRIHFAGLNSKQWAEVLEGCDVLISYADVKLRPGTWRSHILPRLQAGAYTSVILDSGAFTELSKVRKAEQQIAEREGCRVADLSAAQLAEAERMGHEAFHVDVEEYADFALEHLDLFDLVVNLDDIRGDVERSERNQRYLESRGIPAVPVYHQGEDWEVLDRMADSHNFIGVGFQRPIRGGREFLESFFARLAGRARVHGFGMTRWAHAEGFPFDTVDSTTWISEYRALRKPEEVTPLAQFAADLHPDDTARLVLDSYSAPASPLQTASDAAAVEAGAKGQARTVVRRYGRKGYLDRCVALHVARANLSHTKE